jgi:hypothetical protein
LKKPIIYSITEGGENAPIYSQGDYDVFVGALEADKLPMYVVINRNTGVVEFTHEVTAFYKDWLNHFAKVQFEPQVQDLSQFNLGLSN